MGRAGRGMARGGGGGGGARGGGPDQGRVCRRATLTLTQPQPQPQPHPQPQPLTRYADERLPLPDALQQLHDARAAHELRERERRRASLLDDYPFDDDENMSHAEYAASPSHTAALSPAAAALASAVAATAAASAELTDADRSCVVCMDAPREVLFDEP